MFVFVVLTSLLVILLQNLQLSSHQLYKPIPRNFFGPLSSNFHKAENEMPRTHIVTCSTVISPPKTDKTKKKELEIENPLSPKIFKESRDIQKEFDSYNEDDKYKVILYNDPFNKRIYVATCLMETFCWSEEEASGVMMQAHTYGLAVLGEWFQELAEDYCKQLTEKGLVTSVHKSNEK